MLNRYSDFGAATHPGVGDGTHRRRATVERCEVRVGGVRLEVLRYACVPVSGVFSLSVSPVCV